MHYKGILILSYSIIIALLSACSDLPGFARPGRIAPAATGHTRTVEVVRLPSPIKVVNGRARLALHSLPSAPFLSVAVPPGYSRWRQGAGLKPLAFDSFACVQGGAYEQAFAQGNMTFLVLDVMESATVHDPKAYKIAKELKKDVLSKEVLEQIGYVLGEWHFWEETKHGKTLWCAERISMNFWRDQGVGKRHSVQAFIRASNTNDLQVFVGIADSLKAEDGEKSEKFPEQ